MNESTKVITVEWEGPLRLEVVKETCNRSMDYGLYQVYGTHIIFGPNSLLYLGKAEDRSFSQRIPEHVEWIEWEAAPVEIYLGRLGGVDRMSPERDSEWKSKIDVAERLLIYFSAPPYNSKHLQTYGDIKDFVVINYKKRNRLPVEVSTYYEDIRRDGGTDWKVYEW